MNQILVSISDLLLMQLQVICSQEGCSIQQYMALCLERDIESRKDSGWNELDGWDGKVKLDAERAAWAAARP